MVFILLFTADSMDICIRWGLAFMDYYLLQIILVMELYGNQA